MLIGINTILVPHCPETCILLIPSNFSPKRECSPHRDKYRFSTALYRNKYRLQANCPRDGSAVLHGLNTVLVPHYPYRNVYLTLISSNLSPKRERSPARHKYRFSTALYKQISDLFQVNCGSVVINGLNTVLVTQCTETYILL